LLVRSAIKLGLTGATGAIAAIMLLLGGNLWSYSRLTHEADIGVISFVKHNDGFQVSLAIPEQGTQYFELKGDQWQLDTRIIKWKAWATLLGQDTLYQLDRVTGRYQDADMARRSMPTLIDLGSADMVDIWALARRFPDLFFMVDAQYGSSVFLPMEDRVSYRLSMSNTGVLARRVEETVN